MQAYALFDTTGKPLGFYFEEVHGPREIDNQPNPDCLIPASVVLISDEDYQAYIQDQGQWLRDPATGLRVAAPPPPPPTRAKLLTGILAERNQRLTASDWTQMPDTPLTNDQRAAWVSYRQALRAFPETCDLDDLVWPVAPE